MLRSVSPTLGMVIELEMDIYRPNDAWGKLPAIVCIHGGGWAKGSREPWGHGPGVGQSRVCGCHNFLPSQWRGEVSCTDSRLQGSGEVSSAYADEYGIDADHIGAIGLSAGGHLTALLATSGGVAELEGKGGSPGSSSVIQAAVPMGAQTDFLSERTQEVSAAEPKGVIWQQFLGGTQQERPAVYKAASPLTHLDAGDPPCWFIAGEHDDASTHADVFREKMNNMVFVGADCYR